MAAIYVSWVAFYQKQEKKRTHDDEEQLHQPPHFYSVHCIVFCRAMPPHPSESIHTTAPEEEEEEEEEEDEAIVLASSGRLLVVKGPVASCSHFITCRHSSSR
jgi:hypothetical protein